MTVKRTTQLVAETLSNVDPVMRASQVVVESLSNITPVMRASQVVVEMLSENVPDDATGGDVAIIGFFF